MLWLVSHTCSAKADSKLLELVMEDIEYRALTTALVSPSFWKRFVDDVISAVSENEIVVLLQHLNLIDFSIQFTVERETDGKLPFLIGYLCSKTYWWEVGNCCLS